MNSYSSEYAATAVRITIWFCSAVVTGVLAGWKSRNALGWAIAGIFFPCAAFFILLFLPRLCPGCQGSVTYAEWQAGRCPRCGTIPSPKVIAARTVATAKDPILCLSCGAEIPPGQPKCAKCGWHW